MSAFGDQLRQRVTFLAAQRAASARQVLEDALKAAAPVGKTVPFGPVPGELRDSCSVSVRYSAPVFTFTARATAKHAGFTNDGTSAFAYLVQRPRSPSGRPGAVRFFWGRTGNIEFRGTGHIIQNPGIAGTHWWDNTLNRFSQILESAAP